MKRIALLLAGAALASGCVAPCDTTTLDISWGFVDANGYAGLPCDDPYLTSWTSYGSFIDEVDVFVDGVKVAGSVSCSAYSIPRIDVASGLHEVVVEGYTFVSPGPVRTIITRSIQTADVASCGPTNHLAESGEAFIDLLPSSCPSGGYLFYVLKDTTWSPPTEISRTDLSSPLVNRYDFFCSAGIVFAVPYGYYQLAGLEEVNASGVLYNWGTCSDPERAVLSWDGGAYSIPMYNTASAPACPWPVP